MGFGDATLLLLSAASGATDALAFLLLGHVFTSAMTGNTVLLGIALGHGDAAAASRSACALGGFALGGALAGWLLKGPPLSASPRHTVRVLYALEIVFNAAFAVGWLALQARERTSVIYALIILSAMGMGIQGMTARVASRFGTSTVVFTNVLLRTVGAAMSRLARRTMGAEERVRSRLEFTAFVVYGAGAVLAALLDAYPEWDVWLPVAAVLAAALCQEWWTTAPLR